MNIEKELQELINKHHSGEIDSRDEWYREVVDLKHRIENSYLDVNFICIDEGQGKRKCEEQCMWCYGNH